MKEKMVMMFLIQVGGAIFLTFTDASFTEFMLLNILLVLQSIFIWQK